MKNTELRIGNLTNKGIVKDLYEGGVHVGYGKCFKFNEIDPVKITGEKLIELGFMKKKDTYYLGDLGLSWLTTEDNFQTEYKLADSKWKLLDLKYVHQLQNLIFVLTGNELLSQDEPIFPKDRIEYPS